MSVFSLNWPLANSASESGCIIATSVGIMSSGCNTADDIVDASELICCIYISIPLH